MKCDILFMSITIIIIRHTVYNIMNIIRLGLGNTNVSFDLGKVNINFRQQKHNAVVNTGLVLEGTFGRIPP